MLRLITAAAALGAITGLMVGAGVLLAAEPATTISIDNFTF